MKIDLSQFRNTFLQESAENVAAMESGLLALRANPEDSDTLNSIFRSAHSIKGGAGSFGLENLVRVTHALESLLDRLREGEVAVSDQVIAALLESVDVVRALLEPEASGELPENATALIERIEGLTYAGNANTADAALCSVEPGAPPTSDAAEPEAREKLAFYRVEFRPDREMFSSGTNPVVMLRNLAALGRVSATQMHCDDLPSLSELNPRQCYLGWTIELATVRPEEELHEVFEFVEHLAEIRIQSVDAPQQQAEQLGQSVTAEQKPPLLPAPEHKSETIDRRSPVLVDRRGTGLPDPRGPGAPDRRRSAVTDRRQLGSGSESSSIRVSTDKVDRLIDLVGELVIAHVMTAQMVESFTPECLPKLRQSVAAMERNTRELHERVMAVRMLPVGTLFQRYARTVYDIAQATGKQVRLELSGEETEIDKSMLEKLGDPLTHLIRNAADHGIETPEVRVAAGKPAEGAINLRAFHRSGRIVIELSDDGAGIDPQRVRAKAIERGLIAADAQLSDEQLRMLIFEPGFSTRDQVSDLSGRGVGMDVVKQNVRQLNGTVAVASEIGQGSTVTIELPLTLAILEGLLVRVKDRTLVLPLLAVVETVSPKPSQIQRVAEQGEVVMIRDLTIPLLRMERFLGLFAGPDTQSSSLNGTAHRSLVVVVETGRKKIGLVVDELLGQQQVVVKSLERHLRKVEGLMGATILGDGCVAPIVDVAGLAGMNLFSLQGQGKALSSGAAMALPDSAA